MAATSNGLTETGAALLKRLADTEARGRLVKLANALGGAAGTGMPLRGGDGGELAAAKRLAGGGFVKMVGGGSNARRFLQLTDKGRDALARMA